jgi:hypothetical protein
MNLKPIGSNQTEVSKGDFVMLYSYQAPVALWERTSGKFWRTEFKHSRTTSKHINHWLRDHGAQDIRERPQDFFSNFDWAQEAI